jgi:hypothetical protein
MPIFVPPLLGSGANVVSEILINLPEHLQAKRTRFLPRICLLIVWAYPDPKSDTCFEGIRPGMRANRHYPSKGNHPTVS